MERITVNVQLEVVEDAERNAVNDTLCFSASLEKYLVTSVNRNLEVLIVEVGTESYGLFHDI